MNTRRRFPTDAHWLDWLAGRRVPDPASPVERLRTSVRSRESDRRPTEIVSGTDDYVIRAMGRALQRRLRGWRD